jgi:hypothetical protein
MEQLITFLEIAATTTVVAAPIALLLFLVGRGLDQLTRDIPDVVATMVQLDQETTAAAACAEAEEFVPLNLAPLHRVPAPLPAHGAGALGTFQAQASHPRA